MNRAPIVHELKCWPGSFKAILDGRKRYEIRKFDRDYRVGDTLVLKEYDPIEKTYSGSEHRVLVGYITAPGEWGLPNDIGVLSLVHELRMPEVCGACDTEEVCRYRGVCIGSAI